MFTFPPHHVISMKVWFQLNKTIWDTKFIVTLTQNYSQKRQKREKRHILTLCFFLWERVETLEERLRAWLHREQEMFISNHIHLQTI